MSSKRISGAERKRPAARGGATAVEAEVKPTKFLSYPVRRRPRITNAPPPRSASAPTAAVGSISGDSPAQAAPATAIITSTRPINFLMKVTSETGAKLNAPAGQRFSDLIQEF